MNSNVEIVVKGKFYMSTGAIIEDSVIMKRTEAFSKMESNKAWLKDAIKNSKISNETYVFTFGSTTFDVDYLVAFSFDYDLED